MKKKIKPEHRQLIESIIRENKKFKGYEELIDIFFDAIYKKSYLLIDAIKDVPRLKRHLSFICDSCMDAVIKEKKKFDDTMVYKQIEQNSRLKDDIVSLKQETPFTDVDEALREYDTYAHNPNIVNLKEEIQRSERYSATDMLIDPLDFCPQKRVSEHTVEKLIRIVKDIDEQYPGKKYYEIFSLRYMKNLNQTDIAKEMKISQVELSKRFVELIKLTRESL